MSRIMKKSLFFFASAAAAVLLNGCSTITPPVVPVPEAPPAAEQTPAAPEPSTLLDEMQKTADRIRSAGGLAALGTGESKSLDLSLNRAKANGRIALAEALKIRMAALEKAFIEETGIPEESLLLSGFNSAAKIIIEQQIAGGVAYKLKYEPSGDTFTAYAVMVLDPKVIADQLAKEKDLYTRLQPTKAFGALDQEVKSFAAFKAAQK